MTPAPTARECRPPASTVARAVSLLSDGIGPLDEDPPTAEDVRLEAEGLLEVAGHQVADGRVLHSHVHVGEARVAVGAG